MVIKIIISKLKNIVPVYYTIYTCQLIKMSKTHVSNNGGYLHDSYNTFYVLYVLQFLKLLDTIYDVIFYGIFRFIFFA